MSLGTVSAPRDTEFVSQDIASAVPDTGWRWPDIESVNRRGDTVFVLPDIEWDWADM